MEQQVQSVPNDRVKRKFIFVVNIIFLALFLTIIVYPMFFFTPPTNKLDELAKLPFYKGFISLISTMIYQPFHVDLSSFVGVSENFIAFLAFYLWYIVIVFLLALIHLSVVTLVSVSSSIKKKRTTKMIVEIIVLLFNVFQLTILICYCFLQTVEKNAPFVYQFFDYFASLFDSNGILKQFNFLNNPYLTSCFYLIVVQTFINVIISCTNLITSRKKVSSYGSLAREVKKGGKRPIMQEKQDYQIIPTGLFTKNNENTLKKAKFSRAISLKKSKDSLHSKSNSKKKNKKNDLDEKIIPTSKENQILNSLEPIDLDTLGSGLSSRTDLDNLISENELSRLDDANLKLMDDNDLDIALNSLEPFSLKQAEVEDESFANENNIDKELIKPDEIEQDIYENNTEEISLEKVDDDKQLEKVEGHKTQKQAKIEEKKKAKEAKKIEKKKAKNDKFAQLLALRSIENSFKSEEKVLHEIEKSNKKNEKPIEENKEDKVEQLQNKSLNNQIESENGITDLASVEESRIVSNENISEPVKDETTIELVENKKGKKKKDKKNKKKNKNKVEEELNVETTEETLTDKEDTKVEEKKTKEKLAYSPIAIQPNDDYDTTMTTFTREELARGNFGFSNNSLDSSSVRDENTSLDNSNPTDDQIPSGFEGDDNIVFEDDNSMYPETGVGNAKVLFESVPEYNCTTEQTTLYKRWQDKFVRFFDIFYIIIFTLLAVIAVCLFTPLKDYYFNDLMQYTFVRQIIDIVPTRFYTPFNISGMPLEFWGQTSDYMAIVTLYTVVVGTAIMLLLVHLCFATINRNKRHGKRGMWFRTFIEFILILANLFVLVCFYFLCFRNELYEVPVIKMLYDLFDFVANYISLDSPIDILRNFNFNLNPKVMTLIYSLVALIIVNFIIHLFMSVGRSHPLAIKWKKEYRRISTGSGKVVRHIVGRGRGYYGYGGYGIAAGYTKKYGDGDPTHVEYANYNEQDIVKNVILIKYRPIADIIATLLNDIPERLEPNLVISNTEKCEVSEQGSEIVTLNNLDSNIVNTTELDEAEHWILPAYDRNQDKISYNEIKVHDTYVSYTLAYGEGENECIEGLNRARLIFKSIENKLDEPYDEIYSPWGEELYHDDNLPVITSRALEIYNSLDQGFKVDNEIEDPYFANSKLRELCKELGINDSSIDYYRAYRIYLSLHQQDGKREIYSPFVNTSKFIKDVIETDEMKEDQRIGYLFKQIDQLDRALSIYESLDKLPVNNYRIYSPFISDEDMKQNFYEEIVNENLFIESGLDNYATYDDRALDIYHSLDIYYIESLDVIGINEIKDRSKEIYKSLDIDTIETLDIKDKVSSDRSDEIYKSLDIESNESISLDDIKETTNYEPVSKRVLDIYESLDDSLVGCKLLEIDNEVVDPFEHYDDSIILPDPWPELVEDTTKQVNEVINTIDDKSNFDFFEVVSSDNIEENRVEEERVEEHEIKEEIIDNSIFEYYEVVAPVVEHVEETLEEEKLEDERLEEERAEINDDEFSYVEVIEETSDVSNENEKNLINEYDEFEAYEVINQEFESLELDESKDANEEEKFVEPKLEDNKEDTINESMFDYYEVIAPVVEHVEETKEVIQNIDSTILPSKEEVTVGEDYSEHVEATLEEEKLEDERLEEERVEIKEVEKEETKPSLSKPKGPIKIKPVAPIKHEEVIEEKEEEKVLEKISKPLHAINQGAKPEIKPVAPKHVPFNLKEFMIDKYDGYLTPEEAFTRGIAKVRSVVSPVVSNRGNESSWKQRRLEDSYKKNDYANISSVNDLDKYRNVDKAPSSNITKSNSIRDLKKALEEEKLKHVNEQEKSSVNKPIKPITPIKPIEPKKEVENEVIKDNEEVKKELAPVSIKHRLNTKPKPVIKPVDPNKKK